MIATTILWTGSFINKDDNQAKTSGMSSFLRKKERNLTKVTKAFHPCLIHFLSISNMRGFFSMDLKLVSGHSH